MPEHAISDVDRRSADEICGAIRSGLPIAVSKLGFSEQAMIVQPHLYRAEHDTIRKRAIAATLVTHGAAQGGVFPATVPGMLGFASAFQESMNQHSVLAVWDGKWLIDCQARLPSNVRYPHLDAFDVRWAGGSHPMQRILESLQGKRILLVTSPAEFLVSRAEPALFESVWASCRRRWFDPASIEALAIPNVFDSEVQKEFQSSHQYASRVCASMRERDFDVALIAASLCGPVFAAEAMRMGKVGISIGSQLQLLFGIHGKRWYDWVDFQERIVNDAWTTLPDSFRPSNSGFHADGGAYWS